MNFFNGSRDYAVRSSESTVTEVPLVCPSCRSSSITTTAKNPDASSYWRCGSCGEIWNAARRHDVDRGAYRWR